MICENAKLEKNHMFSIATNNKACIKCRNVIWWATDLF